MALTQMLPTHALAMNLTFSRILASSSGGVPLLHVLLVLIVVGILLWLVNRFIPMQSTIKSILNGIVVIGVVLWLLNIFGLLDGLSNIRVGH